MIKSPTATNNASSSSHPAPDYPFLEQNLFVDVTKSLPPLHQCSSPKFTSAILPPILNPKYPQPPQPSSAYAPSYIKDYSFPFPGAREQEFPSPPYQTKLSNCPNGKTTVLPPYNHLISLTPENAIYSDTCQNNSTYDATALSGEKLK